MKTVLFAPVYRVAAIAVAPLSGAYLWARARQGKEDRARLNERRGVATLTRPAGRLAWLHGASVGEGLALLPLVERLIGRGFHVLVTTGTVTSARILAQRLPSGASHQFAPLDAPRFVQRFLDHWTPDLFLLAESELWPNMIEEARRRAVPIVLVNARLSPRSFARWRRALGFIGAVLAKIDLVLAQSQDDATRLLGLGAPRVQVAGNLKYDVEPPPADMKRVAELAQRIGRRPLWVAASTHEGEEKIVVDVHLRLARQFPNLLTIIVPRHVERGGEIAEFARAAQLDVAVRSANEPIRYGTQIYVADTMGELGLFFRLSSIIFMGKSLAGRGGQNPIEPAKLGSAVLHGPHVGNFVDVYATLDQARAAAQVADEAQLAKALANLFTDARLLGAMQRSASEAVEQLAGASDIVMQALEPYFVQMLMERH